MHWGAYERLLPAQAEQDGALDSSAPGEVGQRGFYLRCASEQVRVDDALAKTGFWPAAAEFR